MSGTLKKQFHQRAGTRGAWQRDNLAAWRDARESARAVWDDERIVRLRAAMAGSKTAQAALDWANRHNIEIIIDHTVNAGGYYWPGTGVVAVSSRALMYDDDISARAIGILVHEIRHAWQDYHGLLCCPEGQATGDSPLGRDLAIEALFEADATANAKLAELEYSYTRTQERITMMRDLQDQRPIESRTQLLKSFVKHAEKEGELCANASSTLWKSFVSWYGMWASAYGTHRRDSYAHALGFGKPAKDYGFEYRPSPLCDSAPALDFSQRAVLEQLGRSFHGANYLKDTAVRDVVLRRFLPPGSAERYFPRDQAASKKKPNKQTRQIRAAQLRQRLVGKPA